MLISALDLLYSEGKIVQFDALFLNIIPPVQLFSPSSTFVLSPRFIAARKDLIAVGLHILYVSPWFKKLINLRLNSDVVVSSFTTIMQIHVMKLNQNNIRETPALMLFSNSLQYIYDSMEQKVLCIKNQKHQR